jgi:hypothetical protein
MKITKFNCVEMKHRGAEKVKEKTRDMTREQELTFWQEQTKHLKHFQESKKQEHRDKKASV